MKKIILFTIASLMAIGIVACSSCNESNVLQDASVTDADADVVQVLDKTISKDNWEIILPNSWNVKETQRENVELMAIDPTLANLLVLSKEPYQKSFDQFAIESIRDLRGDGVSIVNTSNINVNGIDFVEAESSKNGIHMTMWVTIKDGFGYKLTCGGPENITDCNRIIKTLKIK